MTELLTERSARIVAARKLTRRAGRDAAGLFLAEGRQAVAEALADAAGVREVFATQAAAAAHADLLAAAPVPVRLVTDKAAAGLSETVTPQGLVAVCALRDVPATTLTTAPPRLAVALAELADPGNAGTVLRTADACGAGAVVFGAGSADPYGGKAVRSSAGSLFHVDVVRGAPLGTLLPELRAAGVTVLAADGGGEAELPALVADGRLAGPVLWLFGNEARGVPAELAELADARVRIPMRGRAESLNLAAAAAICLYTTQLAQ
ncbi:MULTISPECIES: TrmH family RNA methyltransferase [unclassified Blastococcus]